MSSYPKSLCRRLGRASPALSLTRYLALSLGFAALTVITPAAAQNLMPNGAFDHPEDPLHGWKVKYTVAGYSGNEKRVSGTQDGARGNVAQLVASDFYVANQGVKMESAPIPFDTAATYRLSIDARTTGPDARIYLRGYRWRPRVERHDNPDLDKDLVATYNFGPVNFDGERSERFSNPARSWKTGTMEVSPNDMSSTALRHYQQIDFLVLQVTALRGSGGTLFVDNIKLERIR